MDEIEKFLNHDYRFFGFASELQGTSPGKGRDDWLLDLSRRAYRHHNFTEDQVLFEERCRLMGRYITLKDKDDADEGAIQEELNQQERDWGSRYFDPDRGWVHTSFVPYNLGQSERTSGPSHVIDGGCDALERASLSCERTSGPSHGEDGGGDATQRRSGMDRSSPVQYKRFFARDGPSRC
jgi:hypothetical protein